MPSINTAQVLGNALKVSTPLPMWNSITQHSEVWDLFKERVSLSARRQGRRTEISTMFGAPEGTGSRFEDDNLPVPQPPLWELAVIPWKKTVHPIQSSYDAIDEAVTGPTSFGSFLELVLMPAVESATDSLDRQAVGPGSGVICRIHNAYAGGGLVTINIDRAFGTGAADSNGWISGIRRGMSLVAGPTLDGSGLRNGGAAGRVLSVNMAGNNGSGTLTMESVPSEWAANDFLWLGDSLGNSAPVNGVEKEMMGLLGFVDDGTIVSTLQNIPRTTFPEYQALVINAGAAPYSGLATQLLLMRLHDEARIRGRGKIDVVLCSPPIFRNAFNQVRSDGGYGATQQAGGTVKAGVKGIITTAFGAGEVNVRSIVKWPIGQATALDSRTLVRFGMPSGEWDTHGDFWKPVHVGAAVKDQWYNFWRYRGALACLDPRKSVRATGILENVG